MSIEDKKGILKTAGHTFMALVVISLFVYTFSSKSFGQFVKIEAITSLTMGYICYALVSWKEKWFVVALIVSWIVIIFWVF
ncbi:hypothetical protein [Bacillus amyloliquefaciens]|uniref:hypothetical protein n=1 Tax=Bacillus amyloliquefaciens TaxID=1390 RepID=UPI0005A53691|nr:hypothetical protein [Bacillus amyloliquefaciens]APH35443.1 hypothetical protein BHE96_07590 [Bacillus subtilis]